MTLSFWKRFGMSKDKGALCRMCDKPPSIIYTFYHYGKQAEAENIYFCTRCAEDVARGLLRDACEISGKNISLNFEGKALRREARENEKHERELDSPPK
jgi:hypothetical protein